MKKMDYSNTEACIYAMLNDIIQLDCLHCPIRFNCTGRKHTAVKDVPPLIQERGNFKHGRKKEKDGLYC